MEMIEEENIMNEVFIIIDKEKKKIIRVGQACRSALTDEKLNQNEVIIFELDGILTKESIKMLYHFFEGKTELEIAEYSEKKLQLSGKKKPTPAPLAPNPKELLKSKIKATPKPKNQVELIDLVENIREYLGLQPTT